MSVEEEGSAGTLRLSWSGGERGWNRGDGERGRNGGWGAAAVGVVSVEEAGSWEGGWKGDGKWGWNGKRELHLHYSHITLQMLKNVNKILNVDARLHFLTKY